MKRYIWLLSILVACQGPSQEIARDGTLREVHPPSKAMVPPDPRQVQADLAAILVGMMHGKVQAAISHAPEPSDNEMILVPP